MLEGLIAGCALGGLHGLAALWSIRRMMNRRLQTLISLFIGGMVLRLLLVGAGMFVVIRYTEVSTVAFAGALIATIILFQVIEVSFLLKSLRADSPGR